VKSLTPSLQCYLAAILDLELTQGCAKQSEIAAKIGVNRSSATAALRTLSERAMILYEPYSAVRLTPEGEQAAGVILTRQGILKGFLVDELGIDRKTAHETACRIVHVIPDAVVQKISERFGKRAPGD
jgi:DtxR family Mn-dependent transcriptional regulator